MARWNAIVRLPDFPNKRAAEAYAAAEFRVSLVGVVSVADDEVAREERAARKRESEEEDGG